MRAKNIGLQDLVVIYEDNHLIAVNKHPGMLVHEDSTGDTPLSMLVKNYIKKRYGKPGDVFLGVIHRLDRPVSGVVVFARTSKALARMNELMKERKIYKKYYAITAHRPEPLQGQLVHHILKDETKNIVKAYSSKKSGSKEAILEYNTIGELDAKILLEVVPHTGRPHQIRAQLSKIGVPIVGDLKYGADYVLPQQAIGLHCAEMRFVHPVKLEEISIKANVPTTFPWKAFAIED